MSLRLFADHCISNYMVDALRDAGCDVLRLRDHIPCDSPDSIVIAAAQSLDCILLSLNGDFADIVTYPPAQYKGILALHLHNHPEIEPQLVARLTRCLGAHRDMAHYRGELLLIEVHRVRVRE